MGPCPLLAQSGHHGWRRAQFASRNGRPDVTRVTYKFFRFTYGWVLEAKRGHKRESPHTRGRR